MVGMPPKTLLGRWPSVRAAYRPWRIGLAQPPSKGPFTAIKRRSAGLLKLSSLPVVSACIRGAYVAPSIAATSGMLMSMEMYHIGQPKLNPLTPTTGRLHGLACFLSFTAIRDICFRSPQMADESILRTVFDTQRGRLLPAEASQAV